MVEEDSGVIGIRILPDFHRTVSNLNLALQRVLKEKYARQP